MDKHELTNMTINVDRSCKQALLDLAARKNRHRHDGAKWTADSVVQEAIWEYLTRIEQMEAGLCP